MNRNLTNRIIQAGANEVSMAAMRARRDELLSEIEAAEESGQQIPPVQFRAMVGELFDLNIALGDAVIDDKDSEQ